MLCQILQLGQLVRPVTLGRLQKQATHHRQLRHISATPILLSRRRNRERAAEWRRWKAKNDEDAQNLGIQPPVTTARKTSGSSLAAALEQATRDPSSTRHGQHGTDIDPDSSWRYSGDVELGSSDHVDFEREFQGEEVRLHSPRDLTDRNPEGESEGKRAIDANNNAASGASQSKDSSRKRGAKSKEQSTSPSVAGKRRRKSKTPLNVKTIIPKKLKLRPVDADSQSHKSPKVPQLSHGLDRVLFNPGVYHLADPRTGVFNFDPYIGSIMPVDQFDFDALKAYTTSSKDTRLRRMSIAHGKKYCGSTSSMTSILSHFHYLLSNWRELNFNNLSRTMRPMSFNFTKFTRAPAAAHAILQDGVYAIDADKKYDKETVLSMLGKSMEKLFTLPKEEFEKYRRNRSHLLSPEEKNADEAYHYTTLGDFMMRSQLDAHDPRVPGSGMFDLKTRAVVSIRMDVQEYEKLRGYEIHGRFGEWNSFEREYHDMIRAAFLKYSLQVRMGRMDGIFVAYHNTQRIFGFQYISLEEMDQAVHNTTDRRLGDQEFKCSVALLNDLMNRATERFPGRDLRLHVETRPTKVPLTYFFVEPITEDDLRQSEEESQRTAEKVGAEIQGQMRDAASPPEPTTETPSESNKAQEEEDEFAVEAGNGDAASNIAWEEIMTQIENTVEAESRGLQPVREAFRDALEPSNEDEFEALMQDIEVIAAASPGMKEILEARELDLDGTEENSSESAPGETTGESMTTEGSEDNASQTSEPLKSDNDTGVEKSSQAETAAKPEAEAEAGAGVEMESAGEGEGDVHADTKTSLPHQRSNDLKNLILQLTEGIGDSEGSQLRAFISKVAARTKPAGTSAATDGEQSGAATAESKIGAEDSEASAEVEDSATTGNEDESSGPKELLGMYVTIRNEIKGRDVERVNLTGPDDVKSDDFGWKVEYNVVEIPDKEARRIYRQLRARRRAAFTSSEKSKKFQDGFRETLVRLAEQGAQYRQALDEKQEGKRVHVAWQQRTLPPEAARSGLTGDIFDVDEK